MTTAEAPLQNLLDRVVHIDPQSSAGSSLTSGGTGERVVKMSIGFAAEWFGEALVRLEDLASLAPGWDSYGAQSIQADATIAAVRFLASVAAAFPLISGPSIVPLADGGLQVEWHRAGIDLEIAFSDDEPGVYMVDRTRDEVVESPLRDARDQTLRVAPHLLAS
jgi:hypothetical protein